MLEMIENWQTAATREERHDLFSSFLDANDGEGKILIGRETKLTDQELLGKHLFHHIFITSQSILIEVHLSREHLRLPPLWT